MIKCLIKSFVITSHGRKCGVFLSFLETHSVTLLVAFAFLLQIFGNVVGAYEWYYVILWMQDE